MNRPTEPEFVIRRHGLTPDGRLTEADRQRVSEVLRGRGFVLAASDTAYSVAAIPFAADTRIRINTLLRRKDMPVSLAFESARSARRWIAKNPVIERLLDTYCPGPITIVCRTAANGVPEHVIDEAIAAENRTIGVRVPNSIVERDIASATPYPVTTVAVRDLVSDEVVTSFYKAGHIVKTGLATAGFQRWGAIEGNILYRSHSTVVEVSVDGSRLSLIREGDIPFDQIRATAQDVNGPKGSN